MMPATGAIEDLHPLKAVDRSLTCNSNSCLSLPITAEPSDSCKAVIENRAVSMANNDCNKALSSPAEASPAKPASASPATVERTVDTSPATSHIASAADSLPCEGSIKYYQHDKTYGITCVCVANYTFWLRGRNRFFC